ncbi:MULTISPECIES: response regulator transcription factor [Streptomyces]|uniref:DNA-binding response regulator n=1 Tax=Streptomyces venezuelae TaxID=54571 RepID=A0A5P2BHP2_STRVZ|nr:MULTISPECIES: response regulator transcription factor [Streptomyces]NEA01340.1 response regulator transcription factor [Streptomyces sp. SID10116]MYY87411.1 response regulator [Streptomyces sp. SID335]MYZ17025.1 response regulator [Streptomyces sp. SID337]NDZ89630.1 response regulator transcription factor [Streptomyces sp. SID10115]NEB45483.1 response regulator transcription factor [Streptomyces sp. SID339]
MPIDVLVCDQLPVVRNGISAILASEEGIRVIDSTDSGIHAMMIARTRRPHVIITSLDLVGISGLEMVKRLHEEKFSPAPQVVAFTMDDSDEVISAVLHAGVTGLLVKEVDRAELVSAVHSAAQGQMMLAPRVAERLVNWFRRQDSRPEGQLQPVAAALTPRERQVLSLIAKGLSTEQVAIDLAIGIATVRTHVYRLRNKLELKDRAQLVSFAYRSGVMQMSASAR